MASWARRMTLGSPLIDYGDSCFPQVIDPVKASYGVENAMYAVTQLAQTTMRSELGKISLDKTFEERDTLNANIVSAIQCVQCWVGR